MEHSFQSVDSSIPHVSISNVNAANNLRQFQPIFPPGMSWSSGTEATDSKGLEHSARHDSVPDEALFGPGTDPNQDTENEKHAPSQHAAGLPVFDLIIGSSGSSDPEDSDVYTDKDNATCESGLAECMVRPKESRDAALRRRDFRLSSGSSIGNEVFEEERSDCPEDENGSPTFWPNKTVESEKAVSYDEGLNRRHRKKLVLKIGNKAESNALNQEDVFASTEIQMPNMQLNKSKSLPDLILSSSSSSSYPDSVSPDVTMNNDSDQIVRVSQSIKNVIEGPSSIGEKTDSGPKTKKKLLQRTVSFHEHTEHKFIDGKGTETHPLNDQETRETRFRIPSTPTTPDEKRARFSESSGYKSDSDAGSREGASQKSSMESQASNAWSSTESGNGSFEISENAINLLQSMTQKDLTKADQEKSLGSNTISSNGSVSVPSMIFNSDSSTNTVRSGTSTYEEPIAKTADDTGENESTEAPNADDAELPKLSALGHETFFPLTELPTTGPAGDLLSHTQPPSYTASSPSTFSLTSSQVGQVTKEDEQYVKAAQQKIAGEDYTAKASLMPWESLHGGAPASQPHQPRSINEVMWMHLETILNRDNGQMSPNSLMRLYNLCIGISESSTPSPSPRYSKNQYSPDFHSFKVTDLERASRCTDSQCSEMCCDKLFDIKRMLRLDIPDVDPGYPLLRAYSRALWEHSQCCEELKCQVQYCDLVNKWDSSSYVESADPKKIVCGIQTVLVEPIQKTLTEETSQVIKLQDDLPNRSKEDFEESLLALSKIGDFGDNMLCSDIKMDQLFVQQTYPMFEASHQLALYTRLKNLTHPNIVTQLWVLQCEETIKVYTDFMAGGSLLEYIRLTGPLSWTLTVRYMKQILKAVITLHDIGVVYLFWHSGNMLFQDCDRRVIKISSFGFSYPKKCDSDLGATKACLPYNLCPPELLRQNRIDFLSDSWGAGCLMAEMHTGKPVWYKERHEDRDSVHDNIRQNFPKVDTQTTNQKEAFQFCWQSQPERRKSVGELLDHLSAAN